MDEIFNFPQNLFINGNLARGVLCGQKSGESRVDKICVLFDLDAEKASESSVSRKFSEIPTPASTSGRMRIHRSSAKNKHTTKHSTTRTRHSRALRYTANMSNWTFHALWSIVHFNSALSTATRGNTLESSVNLNQLLATSATPLLSIQHKNAIQKSRNNGK